MMKKLIRQAVIEDVPFIQWAVLTAVGLDNPNKSLTDCVSKICCREDVLYSWKNTLVAEIDHKSVGCIIAYKGADYQSMRPVTFGIIAEETGHDFRQMEPETEAGEFYLDSLAVLPEYRGQGVAKSLIQAGIEKARRLHISKVSLVVSPDNSAALHLYESLGFKYVRDMFLFNEDFWKMMKEF